VCLWHNTRNFPPETHMSDSRTPPASPPKTRPRPCRAVSQAALLGVWIGMGMMWSLLLLPQRLRVAIGARLGDLFYLLAKRAAMRPSATSNCASRISRPGSSTTCYAVTFALRCGDDGCEPHLVGVGAAAAKLGTLSQPRALRPRAAEGKKSSCWRHTFSGWRWRACSWRMNGASSACTRNRATTWSTG